MMSTASERLEAEIWLEGSFPALALEMKEQFFARVEEYYDRCPTVERGSDILAALRADREAFATIMDALFAEHSTAPRRGSGPGAAPLPRARSGSDARVR